MDDENREGLSPIRQGVDEMGRLAIETRPEVGQLVEARLLHSPVVGVAPVLDQVPEIVDRRPVLPSRPLDLVREAGGREALVEVLKDIVVDPDLECFDLLAGHLEPPDNPRERA